MRCKAGLFSRFVAPAEITFDGSNGATINVGGSSRSGTVIYTGSGHTTSRQFNMAGTTGGMTLDASGTGALVLTTAISTSVSGAKTVTLTGTSTYGNALAGISPTHNPVGLTKSGTGKWRLTGASSHTGASVVLDGTIVIATNAPSSGNGAFGYSQTGGLGSNSSPVVVLGSDAESSSGTVAMLLDSGALFGRLVTIPALGTGGTQSVVVGGENTTGTTTFQSGMTFFVNRNITLQAAAGGTAEFANGWSSGVPGDGGPLAAAIAVGSSGNTGTVLLSGNLSTSETIEINYGLFKATSTVSATNGITVDGSGAEFNFSGGAAMGSALTLTQGTLSGSGEISSAVTVGTNATLSPGDPVGSQAFSGGLTLASGGTYRWQINNWTGSAGTGFDQLAVSGDDLSITATSGSTFTLKIVGLTSGNAPGAVPNFDNTTSKSFTIATSGTLTGFAANKFTINDSEFTNNNDLDGGTWSLSDSGDDIVLTFTP
jgi:autotransporter-associated beta strand protein